MEVQHINLKGYDVSTLCLQLVTAEPKSPKESVIAGLNVSFSATVSRSVACGNIDHITV